MVSKRRLRPAVRAVIIDPDDRVLLVHFELPDRTLWACPGGGIEPDETDERALRRELAEEAGLSRFDLGPCVWVREHVQPMPGGDWDGQTERFYLVRTKAFVPRPEFSPAQLKGEYLTGIRWWTPDELTASVEAFAPRRLPELLAALATGDAMPEPIDAGV